MTNEKRRIRAFVIRHSEIRHSLPMVTKSEIAADWLTRYTGMPLATTGRCRPPPTTTA
jgi:hypothetical protein